MRNPKILVLDREPALSDQVRGVAAELRPRPEVVPCVHPADVGDVVSSDGPFDVLVAGPSLATKGGLHALQAIHDETPSMTLLLAFAKRPDAQLRDIVRTGAVDLLHIPVSDRALHDSVERAIAVSRPRSTEAVTASTAAKAHQGTVFTVASATGGCGKTFYATNLAYFLHQHTGKRTCIIDLDLQFGEVSTALRLRPRFSIADALARDDIDDVDLAAHIEEYVVAHDTGVAVLSAPRDPADADRIHPVDVTRVIEAARARFDYVVVDTPGALTEIVLAAFDLSSQLYVMATLDLPSIRNMGVFLSTLEKLKIPADNVKLVLNKAERDVGLDVDQVTRMFPQGFTSVLPYAREVSKSVNVGTPILAFAPTAEVSRRMAEGLVPLLPEDNRLRITAHQAAARTGWFARIFRRPASSTALNPTN
ncbi:MAG: AAA family ATPase [Actinomycetota bacterium]|nr:AAA family ATPase [Actinomycetota bacterium]